MRQLLVSRVGIEQRRHVLPAGKTVELVPRLFRMTDEEKVEGDKRSGPTERTSKSNENTFSFANADESESSAYREHNKKTTSRVEMLRCYEEYHISLQSLHLYFIQSGSPSR